MNRAALVIVTLLTASAIAAPTKGPRLQIGKRIAAGIDREWNIVSFTPTRLVMREAKGDVTNLFELDPTTMKKRTLFSGKNDIEGIACDETTVLCVLYLLPPYRVWKNDNSKFVHTLVLVDGATATPLTIPGFSDPSLFGLSSDGRYVVLRQKDSRGIVAYDRTTKKLIQHDAPATEMLVLVSWNGSTALIRHLHLPTTVPSTYEEWSVDTNTTKAVSEPAAKPIVSPDGTRAADFSLTPSTITITEAGKKRTYAFADQQPSNYLIDWVWIDNRWLATDEGYLDTDTMTMAPLARGIDQLKTSLQYAPGSRTAVYTTPTGTFLATLMGP